jgi:hypothetical protein
MAQGARWSYPMSRRGWISVEYAQQIWIPCPPVFPDGSDRSSWASLYAEEWWYRSGRKHGKREITALAKTLAAIYEYAYAAGAGLAAVAVRATHPAVTMNAAAAAANGLVLRRIGVLSSRSELQGKSTKWGHSVVAAESHADG